MGIYEYKCGYGIPHEHARSHSGNPWPHPDNGHIASFNGSVRDECLNLNWFESIAEAKRHAEAWRRDYNKTRPQMALNGLSPAELARQQRLCVKKQRVMAEGAPPNRSRSGLSFRRISRRRAVYRDGFRRRQAGFCTCFGMLTGVPIGACLQQALFQTGVRRRCALWVVSR
jgi:hypothetical protein